MKQLEFDSVISSAWELTKKHWLGFTLLMLVYSIVSGMVQALVPGQSPMDMIDVFRHADDPRWMQQYQQTVGAASSSPMYYISMLLSIVVGIVYEAVVVNLSLRLARGQVSSVSLDTVLDAFRMPLNVYLMFIVCSILLGIICCLGLMCCILPGIYLLGAFFVFESVVIDQPELSILDVFKRTFELTKGNVLTIIGLFFTQIVIIVLGLVCCCVGVFPAIVMVEFMTISIYLSLKEK